MANSIKGLHVCKLGNAPQAGQVKSFVVNGDRIKSKALDQGGQNYTITKVVQSATYKDSYGNIGYDIEIEPANGAQSTQSTQVDRGNGSAMSQDDYWARKEKRDIEAQERMGRCHSQEMAIRYCAMRGQSDMAVKDLRKLIDWFERDIGRSPEKQAEPEPQPKYHDRMTPEGHADEIPKEEEPF
jgi:hypothetical protein